MIEKILITGRLYKVMETLLVGKLNKDLRFLPEDGVSESDLKWADAFVSFRPTANFQFGNLKWVHSLGAGVDAFLFNKEWKKDVLLSRTICSFGQKISEYCLSYVLRVIQFHDMFHQSKETKLLKVFEPFAISTQKIVIFGTGSIGQEVARNFRLFGASVIGVSLSGSQNEHFNQVVPIENVGHVLEDANWVINTLPLTPSTFKLFNHEIFKHLRGACFINVGRGLSVDESSLFAALDHKNLRLVVLDVFSNEPLACNSPLWSREEIIITPHISALTSPEAAVDCFLNTLKTIELGKFPLMNQVEVDKGY
ncbi:D-2-hydroxyacid dehydrogenase [Desulfosporosinus sp. Sb-LF]|uniref:D-2-hydroxyacid dehydrogenase n=1 Tax=Desulfosporosinus sp. Sb-LF TaxID=2560027 RepID=UPI00107FA5A0|nr:D-2-hydroxyacid dehydrogenase [Desulfosporosinus sp. Sb-LF]TGE33391.1 D-2-hydroxyacid dehydrogenase [Desulfosporosinus sp. Sb-LF]